MGAAAGPSWLQALVQVGALVIVGYVMRRMVDVTIPNLVKDFRAELADERKAFRAELAEERKSRDQARLEFTAELRVIRTSCIGSKTGLAGGQLEGKASA